jgi:hypothetical protein
MKQNTTTVGIDLAKKIFHLVGTDITGKIVWRKWLTRHALVPFLVLSQVFMALVGFQGRGCAEVVSPPCCYPFLLEALLFQWP